MGVGGWGFPYNHSSKTGKYSMCSRDSVVSDQLCLWQQWYNGVPSSLKYPPTLYDGLENTVHRNPQAVSWHYKDTSCLFKDFLGEVKRFSDFLAFIGFKENSHFILVLPNIPPAINAIYAVNRLGGNVILVNPKMSFERILSVVDQFDGKYILGLENTISGIGNRANITSILIGEETHTPPSDGHRGENCYFYSKIMHNSYSSSQKFASDPERVAAILLSGGTTGIPKPVVLSNRNLVAAAYQAAAWVTLSKVDTVLSILPATHAFGLTAGINAACLAGAGFVLEPSFQAGKVARIIHDRHISILIGVPAMYASLVKNAEFRNSNLSSLKAAYSGGDVLPEDVVSAFNRIAMRNGSNARLIEGYGLTETAGPVMAVPVGIERSRTIGIPFPDMDVKIINPENDLEVPPGSIGEIIITGPSVMAGYFQDPTSTSKVVKIRKDGFQWLYTGDIGEMGSDGFFTYIARKKNILKRAGYTVFPEKIKAILKSHKLVRNAYIEGIDTPDTATVSIRAIIILDQPSEDEITLKKSIMEFCRDFLAPWEYPDEIIFMTPDVNNWKKTG
jgi:long-chain acyl-CoA synthetase